MRSIVVKNADGRGLSARVFEMREKRIRRMLEMTTVDAARAWIPEEFTVAHYLPSYRLLSRRRQIELNHLYALKFCESTLFLESWIEVCLRQNRGRGLLSPAEIDKFVDEEQEHTGWFTRLLLISRPDRYTSANTSWLLPGFLPTLTHWVGRVPYLDIFWLFLGLYFEERFLTLNRLIQGDSEVDELHRAVHTAHVVDEATHVRDDAKALHTALARSSEFKKWVNARVLRLVMSLIFRNIRFGSSVWRYLKDVTPAERLVLKAMREELRQFIRTPAYNDLVFSKKWNPIATGLASAEPRLRAVLEGMS